MAEYGVPGLKFNIYQARGWGIDGTHSPTPVFRL